MREIKFRAWSRSRKSFLAFFAIGSSGSDEELFYHTAGDEFNTIDYMREDVILMQYTGLKDCRGVEIYEGDILSNEGNREQAGVVEYCTPIAAFVARPIKKAEHDVYQLNRGNTVGQTTLKSEVIGNIYENPEFLKDAS